MAKDHSHPEPAKCKHELEWCEKCQRPYCTTCGKEWAEETLLKFTNPWLDMLKERKKRESDAIPRWSHGPAIPMPEFAPHIPTINCTHEGA